MKTSQKCVHTRTTSSDIICCDSFLKRLAKPEGKHDLPYRADESKCFLVRQKFYLSRAIGDIMIGRFSDVTRSGRDGCMFIHRTRRDT